MRNLLSGRACVPSWATALALLLLALLPAGCGNNDGRMAEVEAERDSLKTLNESQRRDLSEMNVVINTINAAFDSIAAAEGMLFGDGRQEVAPTRSSVLRNLEMFEQVLQRQHAKIDISRLRRQVASQRSRMAEQDATIASLGDKTERQAKALAVQDQEINNGYVIIATKAVLKEKGIARRRKIIGDGLKDLSKFTKIDIRRTTELTFTAKKPRVLTNMPQSAYTLTETAKRTYTLRITNPTLFWGASRVLVIQTN